MTQKLSSKIRGVGAGIVANLVVMTCWSIPQDAAAMAIATVSAEAQFTIEAPAGSTVDVLAFITDDGSNPFTTFGFLDPDGIAGSSAEASGTVSVAPANTLEFNATAVAHASGALEPLIEIAYAQATLTAGFLLINQSATEATDVTISVDWSWLMGLTASGSPVNLALGQVFLDLLVDGIPTEQLVADFLLAPPDVGTSSGGPFSTVLTLAPSDFREVTVNLVALSLAQAMVPAAVPEPGSLALVVLGAVSLGVLRRRGRRNGADPLPTRWRGSVG